MRWPRWPGSSIGTADSSACVYGCDGSLVDLVLRPDLDDLAEVHHGDAVGDVAHDREIVRDEDVRQPEVALQRLEQVHDLRADRDVERRHRLVEDDQLRIERERARDADALPLAAGELVREAVRVLGRETDGAQQLVDALLALPRRGSCRGCAAARRRCRARSCAGSATRTDPGRRSASRAARRASARRLSGVMSRPLKMILPLVGSTSLMIVRESVVLPQPDSPTRPSVSPALMRQVDAVDGVDLADGALEEPRADREVLDEALDPQDLLADAGPAVDLSSVGSTARRRRSRRSPGDRLAENFEWRPDRAPRRSGTRPRGSAPSIGAQRRHLLAARQPALREEAARMERRSRSAG